MVFDLEPIQFVAQGCLILKEGGGNRFLSFLILYTQKKFQFRLKIIPNFWEKKKIFQQGKGGT